MLYGLGYSYLLVDETITNRTETLQLLDCARGDVASVTICLFDKWLRKRGCPRGGYGLVPLKYFMPLLSKARLCVRGLYGICVVLVHHHHA